ncbi:YraN family protein [Lachnospiraceae bacterium 46-15]
MNRRKVGAEYESYAAHFLEEQGYRIVECNYRCRMGEIDIIAREGRYLVFVEVKYRSDSTQGYALEAVDTRKQAVIRKVAQHYLLAHHLPPETPCRFDAVGITGEDTVLVKDGF